MSQGGVDETSLNDVIETLGAIFLTIVLPLILFIQYKIRMRGHAAPDPAIAQEVWDRARRLETRIEHLERLLDSEMPGWRSRT